MDLCAVVSSDGQLQLHWKMDWSAAPGSSHLAVFLLITAAAGACGEGLQLGLPTAPWPSWRLESGESVAEHKGAHYAGIRSLAWVDQSDTAAASTTSCKAQPLAAAAAISSQSTAGLFGKQHNLLPHQRYKRLFAPPILDPHHPSSSEPLPHPYDMSMIAPGLLPGRLRGGPEPVGS